MKEIVLTPSQAATLAELYRTMEEEYSAAAGKIGLTCSGCPDNCCDSYFLHYTYTEWAYLWEGLRALDAAALTGIITRARAYRDESRRLLAEGKRPQLMCPLNSAGLCTLYTHRLMICRLHGIPSAITRPDGQKLRFPGCFRCQEIVQEKYDVDNDVPLMDRSSLLARMAALEAEVLNNRRHLYPKVKRTIAEMIAGGPPMVDKPYCER